MTDGTGLGDAFKPRGDINGIANEVAVASYPTSPT